MSVAFICICAAIFKFSLFIGVLSDTDMSSWDPAASLNFILLHSFAFGPAVGSVKNQHLHYFSEFGIGCWS